MPSIQTTLDELRILSTGLPNETIEMLKKCRLRSRMFAEIFGVCARNPEIQMEFDELSEECEEVSEEDLLTEKLKMLSFEEKRRLFETQFPNKASSEKRERARKMLQQMAENPYEYIQRNSESTENSTARSKSIRTPVIYSARSWKSELESSSESGITPQQLKDLKQGTNFNGVWKFGSYDNFSKMTYDAAYDNTTQSETETPINETSTPIYYDPEMATPVKTPIAS